MEGIDASVWTAAFIILQNNKLSEYSERYTAVSTETGTDIIITKGDTYNVETGESAEDYEDKTISNIEYPKDDLSKAILISNILEQVSVKYVRNLEYHSELEELDARIFAINQMQSLMNKYSLYGNIDFNLHLREQLFVLLYDLRYNYEGIENPEIKKSMQNLKTGIKDAISGECGESCKSCIEKILNSGFDIERAYTAITKNLDKYCSWLVLENYKFNKLGATSIYLAKNGELNYEPRQNYSYSESVIADGSIDPYSEYGEYIKKYACTDNGEYDKLFKGFVEQARNCNSF